MVDLIFDLALLVATSAWGAVVLPRHDYSGAALMAVLCAIQFFKVCRRTEGYL